MGAAAATPTSWEDIARDKRERLAAKIPSDWIVKDLPTTDSVIDFPQTSGFLSDGELEITASSALALVADLAAGRRKSVDVVLAFCKRAALAQQLVNCMHEFDSEMALVQAKELDEYYEKHGKPIGPLHGLPISLKDQLHVKGFETSMGYISYLGRPITQESVLTTLLRQAGAVFYIKTSVPQTLMTGETFNNIIGLTTNPRGRGWSPGGSSGGEGALLALRGSCLGVGTDIGGSIRIPAAFNGLYGIRPCHGRLPYAGMANSMAGQETIHSVVGPLGHSAADLRLFLKAVLAQKPWLYDSKTIPMPWRDEIEDEVAAKIKTKKLNIGYYETDGMAMPHPPILRAVRTTVEKLKQAGHNVVPWEPYKHDVPFYLLKELDKADAGTDLHRDISASGEPAIDLIKKYVYKHTTKLDTSQVWDLQLQKWRYQTEYLDRWREFETATLAGRGELDAIIAPVAPTAAVRHSRYRYYGYTGVLNMLDFTSVVVPVGFADKRLDVPNAEFVPVSDLDRDVQAEYDAEAYHGAPTAVQVFGRRLSEEKTLAIAEELGRLLQ